MISSLFIRPPWSSVDIQWARPASQLGHDRGLSEDQSPGTTPKANGAGENRALLNPRLKVRAGATSRARFQYITIAKAPCQALTAFASRFFFAQQETLAVHRR